MRDRRRCFCHSRDLVIKLLAASFDRAGTRHRSEAKTAKVNMKTVMGFLQHVDLLWLRRFPYVERLRERHRPIAGRPPNYATTTTATRKSRFRNNENCLLGVPVRDYHDLITPRLQVINNQLVDTKTRIDCVIRGEEKTLLPIEMTLTGGVQHGCLPIQRSVEAADSGMFGVCRPSGCLCEHW
jgi:hypothetical protein